MRQFPPLKFGDIVELRDWAKGFFKWPRPGERCIVTQVLSVPVRAPYDGTPSSSMALDIALAFVDPDGDITEFLHDSRRFRKVGTIYEEANGFDRSLN